MKKRCTKCELEKEYNEFYKDKRTKSGLYSACKKCSYFENKEYKIKWSKENRKYWAEYKAKLRRDPKEHLDRNISYAIWFALKGKKAEREWEKLVGYTITDLMKHLENRFDNKMSWDNYGSYWWIDHIKPRSLFKYEEAEDIKFKECWALENLQPMEKIANIRKSNIFFMIQ